MVDIASIPKSPKNLLEKDFLEQTKTGNGKKTTTEKDFLEQTGKKTTTANNHYQ
jgi:hypothetical protein